MAGCRGDPCGRPVYAPPQPTGRPQGSPLHHDAPIPSDWLKRTTSRLFSEIFKRDLDAVVVHLLVLGLELFAALCAAMEESDDVRDRGTTRPIKSIDLRRRSDIEKTVKIVVNYVVIQGANVYAPQRLVADAEHFQPVALRRNVFIAPPTILEPDTAGRGATATFEPDVLGPRPVSRKIFRVRHFDGGDQINDFAHVFAFRGGSGRIGNALQQHGHHQQRTFPEHWECLSLIEHSFIRL